MKFLSKIILIALIPISLIGQNECKWVTSEVKQNKTPIKEYQFSDDKKVCIYGEFLIDDTLYFVGNFGIVSNDLKNLFACCDYTNRISVHFYKDTLIIYYYHKFYNYDKEDFEDNFNIYFSKTIFLDNNVFREKDSVFNYFDKKAVTLVNHFNSYDFHNKLFYIALYSKNEKLRYYFTNLEKLIEERGLMYKYGGEAALNYRQLLRIYMLYDELLR